MVLVGAFSDIVDDADFFESYGEVLLMLTYPLEQKDYGALAEAIDSFSRITQIQTVFYTLDGNLLKDGHIYSDPAEIQQNLDLSSLEIYSIFPVTINHGFWGCVICNSVNVSQQRIYLSRSYLENIVNEVIDPDLNMKVAVWDALASDQLSQIRYLGTLLKASSSGHDPLEKKISLNHHDSISDSKAADENLTTSEDDMHKSLSAAIQYIGKNIRQTISLDEVAQEVFLSPSYLSRIFKKVLDVNFIDYINNQKIAIACEKLALTQLPICHVSNQIGFSQTSYFTKIFKHRTGLTPSEYRHHNSDIQKVYTIRRDLSWHENDTIFDVSTRYFKKNHINYFSQPVNGYPYINNIGGLADSAGNRGWIYTVDCKQPTAPASSISTNGLSVVQWVFTSYDNL